MTTPLFPSQAELDEILVGPESVTWQRTSDVRLNLVMLYALLLQVAHPTVGAGVRDHSDFERDPWTRLVRTIDYVLVLVYGGEEAVAAGRRLRNLHKRFRGFDADGRPYSALEPGAYAWVHATLIKTYVAGHAHFGAAMSRDEVERFYAEYRRLGRLIGVRERDLPATWPAFNAYFDRVVAEELERTEAVDRVLRAVRRVPPPPLPMAELVWPALRVPVADALWLGGVGPMTAAVRERLGISWGWRDEARFRALSGFCKAISPILPRRLKVTAA